MLVVATAGHVDHGKSTLVRALTGMDPDRLAEERRRGLTIELGYVWTTLTSSDGEPVEAVFVDVPGHQRFIGTTIAGLGPAPCVLLVVAADDGWSAQTSEHMDAVTALGVEQGIVAVTRSDLADPGPAADEVRRRLAGTALAEAPVIAVSGRTGAGLDALRSGLLDLAAQVDRHPTHEAAPGASLWVDRAFSKPGAGTVVTGTLSGGPVTRHDTLCLSGPSGAQQVTVRSLQSLGRDRHEVPAPARVAVSLRGVPLDPGLRGARLTHEPVRPTTQVDVCLTSPGALPRTARLHVGTASRPATIRSLDDDLARLSWGDALGLRPGDRGLIHDPTQHLVLTGFVVLDPHPPPLRRRGDARRRAAELTGTPGIRRHGELLIEEEDWVRWRAALRSAVGPEPVPTRRTLTTIGMPHAELLPELATSVGLVVHGGMVTAPEGWEQPVRDLEATWARRPFQSPTQDELTATGLTAASLNAAAAAGRVLRLAGGVLLPGDAASRAAAVLATLPEPFTVSRAREALGTSRRVAVPLLEHLDRLGVTRRVEDGTRLVVHRSSSPR